jgi:AcrR family transcriptional regulator
MSKSDSRIRLLHATADAIAENGIRGLRLEDVAARAEVALSLIYYHFGNRIDLLRATFQFVDENSSSTILSSPGAGSAYARIEAGLLGEFDGPRARSNAVVWSELTSYSVFEPRMRAEIETTNETWVAKIEALVGAGREDGSIRGDATPRDEAEILTSLLDGLISRWISGSLTGARARELLRATIRRHLAAEA